MKSSIMMQMIIECLCFVFNQEKAGVILSERVQAFQNKSIRCRNIRSRPVYGPELMNRRVRAGLKWSSHPTIHSSADVKRLHLFPPRPRSHNVPLGAHHHPSPRRTPRLYFIPSFIFISPLNRHSLAPLSLCEGIHPITINYPRRSKSNYRVRLPV